MTKLVCNAKLGLPMTCHILPYHKLAAQKIIRSFVQGKYEWYIVLNRLRTDSEA